MATKNWSDYIGKKCHKLTVLAIAPPELSPSGRSLPRKLICECECGRLIKVQTRKIETGQQYSCGCAFSRDGTMEIRELIKEQGFSCLYRTHECVRSRKGLCCYHCSEIAKCELACKNHPLRCGSKENIEDVDEK